MSNLQVTYKNSEKLAKTCRMDVKVRAEKSSVGSTKNASFWHVCNVYSCSTGDRFCQVSFPDFFES